MEFWLGLKMLLWLLWFFFIIFTTVSLQALYRTVLFANTHETTKEAWILDNTVLQNCVFSGTQNSVAACLAVLTTLKKSLESFVKELSNDFFEMTLFQIPKQIIKLTSIFNGMLYQLTLEVYIILFSSVYAVLWHIQNYFKTRKLFLFFDVQD